MELTHPRIVQYALERAALLADGTTLDAQDFRFPRDAPPAPTLAANPTTLEELEIRHIERTLKATGGRVAQAATTLGIPRSTLYQKLKRFGIDPNDP